MSVALFRTRRFTAVCVGMVFALLVAAQTQAQAHEPRRLTLFEVSKKALQASKNDLRGSYPIDLVAPGAVVALQVGDALALPTLEYGPGSYRVVDAQYSITGNRVIRAVDAKGFPLVMVVTPAGAMQGSFSSEQAMYRFDAKQGSGQLLDLSLIDETAAPIDDGAHIGNVEAVDNGVAAVALDQRAGTDRRIAKTQPKRAAAGFGAGDDVLDILVYYDDDFPDYAAALDEAMGVLNTTLDNSGAGITARIVGLLPADIDDEETALDTIDKMSAAEYPFESIGEDDANFRPDLIQAFRGPQLINGNCGRGQVGVFRGRPNSASKNAVTIWDAPGNGGSFCYVATFAHEVGHNFGLRHNRGNVSNDDFYATDYSFGYRVAAEFTTVMGIPGDYREGRIPTYSDPSRLCGEMEACGRGADDSESADNVLALNNVRFAITSRSEGYAPEVVSVFKEVRTDYQCPDGRLGTYYGTAIQNGHTDSITVESFVFYAPDDAVYIEVFSNSVLSNNRFLFFGYCDIQNLMGSRISQSSVRYRHPETGEVIETARLNWDINNLEQTDVFVRAGVTPGGSVVGAADIAAPPGQSVDIAFEPDDGYRLLSVKDTCGGTLTNGTFATGPLVRDCKVEATFTPLSAPAGVFRNFIEEPVTGQTHSGVGNLRGWALAESGIDSIEIYIDGEYQFDAPYGGRRDDVGSSFPDVMGAANSGYSLAFNYGDLSPGSHTITARARAVGGELLESSATFEVVAFAESFIAAQEAVNLNSAQCDVQNSRISIVDALVDGNPYDLVLQWRTAKQGFVITDIR